MPLADSQPTALSAVYAKSLFESRFAEGGRSAVEETMGELEDILELIRDNGQLGELMSTPAITVKDRGESLDRMFKGKISDSTLRFMHVMNQRSRLSAFAAVVGSFDHALQQSLGRVEVDVFTAAELDTDAKNALSNKLGTAVGREVVLHAYVDASMIGGVKVRIGDQLIDGSVSTQLRSLRDRLSNEGMANARAKMDRLLGS